MASEGRESITGERLPKAGHQLRTKHVGEMGALAAGREGAVVVGEPKLAA